MIVYWLWLSCAVGIVSGSFFTVSSAPRLCWGDATKAWWRVARPVLLLLIGSSIGVAVTLRFG